jgi:predicted transcriptional regulator
VDALSVRDMKKTQAQLKILSKRHTWEILTHILKGSKYITQIAEETRIPYTTVQHRVTELRQADLVAIKNEVDSATGKAIKIVRPTHFKLVLTPEDIIEMMDAERGPTLRLR